MYAWFTFELHNNLQLEIMKALKEFVVLELSSKRVRTNDKGAGSEQKSCCS